MIKKLSINSESRKRADIVPTLKMDLLLADKINEIIEALNLREQQEEEGRESLRKNIKPM